MAGRNTKIVIAGDKNQASFVHNAASICIYIDYHSPFYVCIGGPSDVGVG